MTTRRAAGIAQDMAELARELNYATLPQEGYPGLEYPADVYEVIASLKVTLQRLPQALAQGGWWLHEQHEAGKVGHDSGGSAGDGVGQTRYWMETTGDALHDAADMLNHAHTASAHLKAAGQ